MATLKKVQSLNSVTWKTNLWSVTWKIPLDSGKWPDKWGVTGCAALAQINESGLRQRLICLCLISRDLIQESGKRSTVSCAHRSVFSCKTSRARHLLFSFCLKFVFRNICMDCPGRVSLIQMSSEQSSPTIGQMAQCSCRGTMAQFVASTWWLTTAYNFKIQRPPASTCTRHAHGAHICKQALTHTHTSNKS